VQLIQGAGLHVLVGVLYVNATMFLSDSYVVKDSKKVLQSHVARKIAEFETE
jgi:hypothetical protein